MRASDDRDRPVRIPMRHVRWLARRNRPDAGPRPRRSFGRAVRDLARVLFSFRVLSVLLPALGASIILGVLIVLMTQDRAMAIGLLVFSPVYVPLMMLLMISGRGLFGIGRSLAGDVIAAMLARMRCPACGYDLSRSPVESDGCRQCPECGAAWSEELLGKSRGRATRVVVVEAFKAGDGGSAR